MPLLGPGGGATTPRIGHAQLRHPAADHVLGGLPAVDPRNPAVGEAGGRGSQPHLLQEAAAHVGGDLRRGRRDPQDLVDDRDRVTGDVGAGHHRQRGIPFAVPLAAVALRRLRRARRRRVPPVTGADAGPAGPAPGPPADADQLRAASSLAWAALRSSARRVDFLLLFAELAVHVGQRRHRGVLAGLSVGDGLVGLLLGQPRRRLLVHLLGAGPLQVVHHLLRTGGQRLAGGRGRRSCRRGWPP